MDQPYRGLQPYQEQDEKFFFGRDNEKAILIDKILADKLTLLFASSGVGKSSLLQAAVMPELKRATGENLDVVYYNDWVSPPLEGLRQKILSTLQERGKITHPPAPSLEAKEGEQKDAFSSPPLFSKERGPGGELGVSFHDFLYLCAAFASEPLVIILDQFEEFFQYQRYTAQFEPFIAALAEAIRDRATPVNFLIAMREDFALNLNAFKGHLPTMLFENYFRLEKLERAAAKAAIEEPVKNFQFTYEAGLLDELLNDLTDQERESRLGARDEVIPENAPAYVEPPNVQIVCSQLWELEKDNPAQVIRARTYRDQGGAKGFIKVYFQRVISAFTPAETRLASQAFDHLVTPRGTKMAYPVAELSAKLRVAAAALTRVLAKLEHARILRSQERKRELWYELYHDIFAGIITGWNTRYKERQRTRRALLGAGLLVLLALGLVAGYDAGRNLTRHALRVNLQTDSANQYLAKQIEVYRGDAASWDLFGLQRYVAEADYGHPQLEPDKFFSEPKPIANYQNLNVELIGQLPIVDRIQAYWQNGEIEKAFELADKSIKPNDLSRVRTALQTVAAWRSPQVCAELIQPHLKDTEKVDIRAAAIDALTAARCPDTLSILLALLNDDSATVQMRVKDILKHWRDVDGLLLILQQSDAEIKQVVTQTLGEIVGDRAVDELLPLLADENVDVREAAAQALALIGDVRAMDGLLAGLGDEDSDVRQAAAEGLARIGDVRAMDGLLARLGDEHSDVRKAAVDALARIGDVRAMDGLLARLGDEGYNVRKAAAQALGAIGDMRAVEGLIAHLTDDESNVRQAAVEALGQLGDARAVEGLLVRLTDEDEWVRSAAAQVLGAIGGDLAVDGLLVRVIADEHENDLRSAAAEALVSIGGDRTVDRLVGWLADDDADVRESAAEMLGQIGDSRAVAGLIARLTDDDADVRYRAAEALWDIGDTQAVAKLLVRLEDDDKAVRYGARRALVQIGDAQVVTGLIARLSDENASTREDAATVLGEIGGAQAVDSLLSRLTDENEDVRRAAVWALGQIGDARVVDMLIARLTDENSSVREAAVQTLGTVGGELAVDGLLDRLADENANVRQAAAEALGQIGDARAVNELLTRLADESWPVRQVTAQALGEIGDARAVAGLLTRLTDEERYVRQAAAQALGEIEDVWAVDGLLARLADGGFEMRWAAAEALGAIGDMRAVDGLLARLADDDASVRDASAQALGQIGNVAAIPALLRLLPDTAVMNYVTEQGTEQRKFVQRAAALALAQFHAPEAIAPLQAQLARKNSDHVALAAALLALGQNDGLAYLQAAVENNLTPGPSPKERGASDSSSSHPSPLGEGTRVGLTGVEKKMTAEERKDVAFVLGAAPSPEGSQILRALLNDPDNDVKLQAITSLGQSHDPAQLSVLQALLNDTNNKIREAALAAIIELAAPDNQDFLKAHALDPQAKYPSRMAALRALGKIGADATLLELLGTQDMAAFTLPIIQTLGNMRSAAAREPLQHLLHAQSARRAQWRKIMAETPTEEQKQAWLSREAAVHPQTDLEFHVAYALSRIDPATGVKLLEHDLANVRAGAWTGLAQIPLTDRPPFQLKDGTKSVEVVIELDRKRAGSKDPLFKHAAYRAMDGLLITIETYGGAAELAALQKFLPQVQDQEGVKTRVDWTIARLQENYKD